jgi:hypothetical protein
MENDHSLFLYIKIANTKQADVSFQLLLFIYICVQAQVAEIKLAMHFYQKKGCLKKNELLYKII